MLKAIESELYKVSKSDDHYDDAYVITIKDTDTSIIVFKNELSELVELLNKAEEIL